PSFDGNVQAVDGLSFSLERGRTLGIVGESGSGKSVTAQAIMGLHKGSKAQISGEIWLEGSELVGASEARMRDLRGQEAAMIFQDPLSSLHPFYTVGKQIAEAYRVHNKVNRKAARSRAVEMLERVGIPNPDKRFDDYPHQFSGGMRQRAMIAMALVCDPKLLIADEPTTALDVTVQAQIIELMKELQREFDSAILLITHDLGVVAESCDDVVVMYAGNAVEYGTVEDIFYRPEMPYTWGLLASMPRMDRTRSERLVPIPGQPPSLINVPHGCVFNARCQYQHEVDGGPQLCRAERPLLLPVGPGADHEAKCHIDPERRRAIWSEQIGPTL
ncbi:MAG: oligopeptide/dipeptide transporter, ATPase subunit, partial [Pseudonocardiales bacterium]|nr:oligopeptide/dipeptide transporter, ATPase subunit [Pseudonocardiales bacterium]